MKHINSIFYALLVFMLLSGCSAIEHKEVETSTSETSAPAKTSETTTEKPVDKVQVFIDSMTLEERVGQLFIVAPEALCSDDGNIELNGSESKKAVTTVSQEVKETIQKYHIGGIVLFANNITNPDQIMTFNKDLQATSDIPLFIAVDEEGGKVARLAKNDKFNLTKYKSAAAVGASGEASDAYEMGSVIGSYLKEYGFNMNFAPVADINSNPKNPVIGDRSFSSDPSTVAKMAGAAAKGLRDKGIIPTFKHFSGHGDTAEDSHQSLAINNHNLDTLMVEDWLPFISNNLRDCAVMVGHIALPSVTGNSKSAVIDKEIVTTYLREKIGFDGLVITDSMKMNGVSNYYDSGTACIMAINAGCDILLMPQNFVESYYAVLSAVNDGIITEERLNKSLYRIISMKYEYSILYE